MHNPEFHDTGPVPFPMAPNSLCGGAAALGSRYAWSEWGGVPVPTEKQHAPVNPDDAAKAAQQARQRASADAPAAARRVQERAEARQRHKVQTVLDTLRRQVEMHGSIAAAFRKLEVSGDSKISHEELAKALKHRFNIEMTEETTKGCARKTGRGLLLPPPNPRLALCPLASLAPPLPPLASPFIQPSLCTTNTPPASSDKNARFTLGSRLPSSF